MYPGRHAGRWRDICLLWMEHGILMVYEVGLNKCPIFFSSFDTKNLQSFDATYVGLLV